MKEELKLPVMLKLQRYAFKGGGGTGKIKNALAKCDRNQMKPRSIKII